MLNPFPDLLLFSFFAPTILRIVVGLIFVYLAYGTFSRRTAIAHMRLPIVGETAWVATFAATVELTIGLALIAGFYTQIAAILGVIVAVKGIYFIRHYRELFPLSRTTNILILAICLSLLISGAGAFAYDLPL